MKLKRIVFLATLLLPFCGALAGAAETVPAIPVKDTVTLADFGATTCIPCKMMAPILEELKREYKGRAEVIFVNIYDPANAGLAQKFKVLAIPTQIFFDKEGKEVSRHLGFMDKKGLTATIDSLLAK